MIFLRLFLAMLKNLEFYSGCDEIKVTWDGQTFAFWFDWHKIDWHCRIPFTEHEIQNKLKDNIDIELYILDIINELKRRKENGEEV